MSKELRTFLRSLDAMYIDDQEMAVEYAGGSRARERIVPTPLRSTVGMPATGLWQNCYDTEWLATLKPHERRALKIIKKNYMFEIKPTGKQSSKQPEFVQGSSQG